MGAARRAQVMVANIRCTEIMEEQLRALEGDQAWVRLSREAQAGLVPGFGAQAAALLDSCLTGMHPLTTCTTAACTHARPPFRANSAASELLPVVQHGSSSIVTEVLQHCADGCPRAMPSVLGESASGSARGQATTRRRATLRTACGAARRELLQILQPLHGQISELQKHAEG